MSFEVYSGRFLFSRLRFPNCADHRGTVRNRFRRNCIPFWRHSPIDTKTNNAPDNSPIHETRSKKTLVRWTQSVRVREGIIYSYLFRSLHLSDAPTSPVRLRGRNSILRASRSSTPSKMGPVFAPILAPPVRKIYKVRGGGRVLWGRLANLQGERRDQRCTERRPSGTPRPEGRSVFMLVFVAWDRITSRIQSSVRFRSLIALYSKYYHFLLWI